MNDNVQNDWPPIDEPVLPATVAARLDEIGWTADCTRLVDHTTRHALAEYRDGLNPPRWVLVNLVDGHRVASYGTEDSGRRAFAVFARRDTDEQGDDQ